MLKLQLSASFGLILALAGSASAQPLAIVTTALPSAAYGLPYTVALTAVGGTPPYQWCGPGPSCPWSPGVSFEYPGLLPPGITLSAEGQISGTPEAAGSFSFRVQVEDATGATQTSSFYTVDVPATGPLMITSGVLTVGLLDEGYEADLWAAGGMLPYGRDPSTQPTSSAGWLVVDTARGPISGTDHEIDLGTATPPGLTLDIGGKLSGTPTQAGDYILTVQVTDSSVPPQVAMGMVTFTVVPMDGLRILNTAPPEGTKGAPYSLQLATNATDALAVEYLVIDSAGHNSPAARASLPPGITLSLNGLLSGVASVAGTYSFLVQATDGENRVAAQALQLVIVDSDSAPGASSGGCSSVGGDGLGGYGVVLLALAAMSRSRKRR